MAIEMHAAGTNDIKMPHFITLVKEQGAGFRDGLVGKEPMERIG
jgi:hypothetical protein